MDFTPTAEHDMLRRMVRDFADRELVPFAREHDEKEEFPASAVKKLHDLDLMAMMVPEKYGGGGSDPVAYAIAIEELSRGDASVGCIASVNNSLVCDPILRYATEEQKAYYLPRLAKEWLGAYALTEPWSGSDAGALRTTAKLEGDEWILDGQKLFVTNAWHAQVVVTYAKTDPRAGRSKGISAFIVPTDAPGFHRVRKEKKMGIRATDTVALALEDCRVPKENLLGERDEGFKIALSTLDGGRIGIASQALGIAVAAFEAALRYSKEREQFGQRISEFQGIQWKLADMATEIDAARLLIHRAAWLRHQRRPYSKEASMAKLYASDVAVRATREAVQVHGGYGYIREYDVERFYRDAKITELYEGTSEVQRLVIARHLLKGE